MEAPAAAKDETLAIVAEAASETPAAASGVTLAAIADAASKAAAAPQKGRLLQHSLKHLGGASKKAIL